MGTTAFACIKGISSFSVSRSLCSYLCSRCMKCCGCSLQMHYQQQHIRHVLECKQIEFEEVDISDPSRREDKQFMQAALRLSEGDLPTLPPQIFKQQQYRGVSGCRKC